MQRQIGTGQFRRRLTVAFIVVAGIAAATVGIGAYLLVRDVRTDEFVERSVKDAEANYLALTEQGDLSNEAGLERFVNRIERRLVDATLVTFPQGEYTSHPQLSRAGIPADLFSQPAVDGSDLAREDLSVAGEPFLVIATPETPSGVRMFFLYSKQALEEGLNDLAAIVWRLCLVVVVAAALVGNTLARRTLRPVSRASAAAHSLAEGLLETRLRVDREDEFGAWALSFNEMADALQSKISELTKAHERERQFTADVSHELRTPLTALLTSASMLDQRLEVMDPETRWSAQRMIREARRLRKLVDELLEMARLQSGREVVAKNNLDLDSLVESIIRTHGWQDDVRFTPGGVAVCADKARAERIVVNLISNAVEHGQTNPHVVVGDDEQSLYVKVLDEGPGIPREQLAKVFDRFFKADLARSAGSGLGLAIAAEHARLLGGTIAVESDSGRGAIFTLRLPRNDAALERDPESIDTDSLQT